MNSKIFKSFKNVFDNNFELLIGFGSIFIISLAILLDKYLYLQACPLCILTRYVFALVATVSMVGFFINKKKFSYVLILITSAIGACVTGRQIYIQNMSIEDIASLSGCSMPFHTQVEYFGAYEAIKRTLAGGPSCAEDGLRFIFNFAEWGFVFFLMFMFMCAIKLKNN